MTETPPRAWGRPEAVKKTALSTRNTPPGVGKTIDKGHLGSLIEKHPHGRGEDSTKDAREMMSLETPPRAWGRLLKIVVTTITFRNTPTGVGKTYASQLIIGSCRKHPHGRGEDSARNALYCLK